MRKRWYLKEKDFNETENTVTHSKESKLEIDPFIRRILGKRGLTGEKEIQEFLYGGLDQLHDPFKLKGMETAVARIITGVRNKERIIVFGDYDVDGITSTTLLVKYFKDRLDTYVDYYLPDRQKEGYGLNLEAIKEFIKENYQLVITVDCGISAHQEIKYAREKGLDVIITDHHQAGDSLPDAVAVIDPHQQNDQYPFKYLAGVGVAFKLCQALEIRVNNQFLSSYLKQLLDIVTLGTVADIAPLLGENRIIVKEGLNLFKDSQNTGLKTLIKEVGLADKDITPGHIGYIIAPHLNAAGRVSNPEMGIKLLTTTNPEEALEITRILKETNNERREIEDGILAEAIEMVDNELNLQEEKAIILASPDWHHGVIGIVASRLVERYYRPVILLVLEDGIGRGSCRSISNLNVFKALKECSEYLEEFGGHEMAAGLTIKAEKLADFKSAFNRYLSEILTEEDFIPELEIDGVLSLNDIDLDLYKKLEVLEPYGVGNPRPRFILNNIQVANCYSVGKGNNHLKIKLETGLKGIGFGLGEQSSILAGERADLAFFIDLNEWNGKREVQLKLEDFNIRDKTEYHPVYYAKGDLIIADKRGCTNKEDYLALLLERNHKMAVYINDLIMVQRIKDKMGNAVFQGQRKKEVEAFNKVSRGIIIFTNQLITEMTGVDDLVFLSLPFSIKEMAGIINPFLQAKPLIHFLFGQEELEINKRLIISRLPGEEYLRRLYFFLHTMPAEEFAIKELEKVIGQNNNLVFNPHIIEKSLSILEELNLIKRSRDRIRRLPTPQERLDLSHSISYNITINISKNFYKFVDLVYKDDLFIFIDHLYKILKEEN